MSRIINYRISGRAKLLPYLGAADGLTPDQRRVHGMMLDRARREQAELDCQGVDLGLTVPAALEQLTAGRADSTARYAGGAYTRALQCMIACTSSDPNDLGVYSRPSTFFSLLDEELTRAGVDPELLFHARLFSGPPDEIPFPLPHPGDGPYIGMFPLALAGRAAEAYRAALDLVGEGFRHDLRELAELLEFAHRGWEPSTGNADRYGHDTIYFFTLG
ncbi:hypothetical protein [Kitasatospora sp. NPDC101183]|uniref:DUF7691 family protein n=1 Tax=Kitasatospora sp. NPDC101183 TaxID=3364100 RepID=UPI0037F3D911